MKFSTMRRTILVAGAAVAMALAGSMSAQSAGKALRIAVYPGSLLSLPEYVGKEIGIYEKHNLDVTLLPIPTGPDQIAAAASGSADVVGNTVGNSLLANGQGQDLVVVANSFNAPLYTWLRQPSFEFAGLDKPYPQNIKGFKGARIGISTRGSEVELFTRILLKDAGLDPERDVTWVPVGFGQTAIAAFEAKQVDIIVSIEPVQSILESRGSGEVVVDLTKGQGPKLFQNFPGQSRISRRSVVADKADEFADYLKAHEEILSFISDSANTDKVAAILAGASGQPVEIAKAIVGKYIRAWGYKFDCAGYDNVVTYLVLSGQFKEEAAKKAQTCKELVAPVSQGLIVN